MINLNDFLLVLYIFMMLLLRVVSHRQRKTDKSALQQVKIVLSDPTAIIGSLVAAIAFSLPIIEFLLNPDRQHSIILIIVGSMVIISGIVTIYFANGEIGKNWSPVITKIENQVLVTSGIYSIIRNPLYLSGLLILVGSNIYFFCKWAWFGAIGDFVFILIRIILEERQLEKHFGDNYYAYKCKTYALIPWIY